MAEDGNHIQCGGGNQRGGSVEDGDHILAGGGAKSKGGQWKGMAQEAITYFLRAGEVEGRSAVRDGARGRSHTNCGPGQDKGRSAARHGKEGNHILPAARRKSK